MDTGPVVQAMRFPVVTTICENPELIRSPLGPDARLCSFFRASRLLVVLKMPLRLTHVPLPRPTLLAPPIALVKHPRPGDVS